MHIIYLHEALPVESDIISGVKFTKGPAMRVVCEHIVQYFTIPPYSATTTDLSFQERYEQPLIDWAVYRAFLKTGWTHLTCTQGAFRICETPAEIDLMIHDVMGPGVTFGAEAD